VTLGVTLRLHQFIEQVLIEDEWHAVHRILSFTAAETFRTFGHSDHCIPLTLLYGWIADHFGLSETLMRAPMMAAGILLLFLFPWYIARRLGWPTALLFALFLAISPLLISYSRMARPFALTVFLSWLAHAAFLRFWAATTTRQAVLFGTGYVTSAALATWLHLIVAPFVAAPFLWGLWQLFRSSDKDQRKTWLLRGTVLAASFAVVTIALIAPPLIGDLTALSSKSGADLPNRETLKGASYFWTGATQTWAMIVCIALMIPGLFSVCRLPIVRTGLLGIALTLIGILVLRPSWVFVSVTFTRYLLPLLPLLLLFLAAGCLQIGQLLQRKIPFLRGKEWMVAAIPFTAMVLASPLYQSLRIPNSNSLDYYHVLDYRPWFLPLQMRDHKVRASSFWKQRAALPAASERIAVAPFSFESDKWPATPLEALSKQRIIPAYLNGFCHHNRSGELLHLDDKRFRFRNAVFLTDVQALRDHRIDWIVWQKTFPDPVWKEVTGKTVLWDSTDLPACEAKWRATFGTPDVEDEFLIAYRVKNL